MTSWILINCWWSCKKYSKLTEIIIIPWKRVSYTNVKSLKKQTKLKNQVLKDNCHKFLFSSVQSLSPVWLLVTQWTTAFQVSLYHQLLESTQTHVHWVSNASNNLVLCLPLLLLPSIFPSIKVFSNESALHIRWSKYWRFTFSISPSNEHPGLISFRMDWLDLLAVQGTL